MSAKEKHKRTTWLFLVALVATTMIGPLAVHMYLPIMPKIQEIFSVSTAMTTFTFSIMFFVMAFGTLIYGRASDTFGRKPILLIGLTLFVLGSALCSIAWNFEILLIGRLIQAMAAGCGVVLARAIARDVYGPEKLAQVIAYITVAYVLGPTLAPPIGGLISDFLGWKSVFGFATVASVIIMVMAATVIPETHFQRTPLRGSNKITRDYRRLFQNPIFFWYAMTPAFTSGAFFSFSTYATFLMRDQYGGTSGDYGLYFMLLTIGFMSGNYISGRFTNRVKTNFMVLAGCIIGIITIELLAASVLFFPNSPLALFLPGALLGMAQGLALPYAQAAAINAEPNLTGTASGIVMFLQFLAAAVASLFISTLYDGTFFPLIEVIFFLSALALCSAVLANYAQNKRNEQNI